MARLATRSDYARLIKELLPPGVAFPREDTTSEFAVMIDEIAGLCASLERQAAWLVEESDPLTCSQSFEDWETDWGLPDSCVEAFSEDEQTMAQRRAMLLFKTRFLHGQSRQFFIDLAAFFGREATVEELRNGEDHSLDYTWRITFRDEGSFEDEGRLNQTEYEESSSDDGLLSAIGSAAETTLDQGYISEANIAAYDQASVLMGANDPLASWGDALIECVIKRYKPAHTTVHFAYA